MNYFDRLHPWCIVRLLPNVQRITVGRFRRRGDAEAHQSVLRQMLPQANFVIVFDIDRPECPIDANFRLR